MEYDYYLLLYILVDISHNDFREYLIKTQSFDLFVKTNFYIHRCIQTTLLLHAV